MNTDQGVTVGIRDRGLTSNARLFVGATERHFGSSQFLHQQHQLDVAGAVEEEDEKKEDLIPSEVQEANERCLGNVNIEKVNSDQWGVFTSRPFTKGSTVISSTLLNNNNGKPNPSPESCSHSIQIDWDKHILMALPARFLNHSCDPNIVVGGINEGGSYDFVALRDIADGEQVRFDYETTEYEVGAFSECRCGAWNCRGTIRGFKHHADVIRAKYGENIPQYLKSVQ